MTQPQSKMLMRSRMTRLPRRKPMGVNAGKVNAQPYRLNISIVVDSANRDYWNP